MQAVCGCVLGTMQHMVSLRGPCNIWPCFRDFNNYSGGPCFQAQINTIGFYLRSPARQKQPQCPGSGSIQYHGVLRHDRNNQIMDVDWEAEWNSLSNESWVAEKNLAGTLQKMVREFRRWWDRHLPSFSAIPRLLAETSLRFNREVLSKRCKRSPTDALDRVEPQDIKMYLIFRIWSSVGAAKRGLR